MIDDEKMNQLIDQGIAALAFDNPSLAADALQELAYVCSVAGDDGKQIFESVRKLVIVGAEAKTNKIFIKEKLEIAEEKLRERRTGTSIITH